MTNNLIQIKQAYEKLWGNSISEFAPHVTEEILKDFPELKIIVFPPSRLRDYYIYATLGMSELSINEEYIPEAYIISYEQSDAPVHALSGLMEHVQDYDINFGSVFPCSSIEDEIKCTHLLAAYPFLDGEGFPEIFVNSKEVLFLWLLPISTSEVDYINKNGYEALEELFIQKDMIDFGWDRDPII